MVRSFFSNTNQGEKSKRKVAMIKSQGVRNQKTGNRKDRRAEVRGQKSEIE